MHRNDDWFGRGNESCPVVLDEKVEQQRSMSDIGYIVISRITVISVPGRPSFFLLLRGEKNVSKLIQKDVTFFASVLCRLSFLEQIWQLNK